MKEISFYPWQVTNHQALGLCKPGECLLTQVFVLISAWPRPRRPPSAHLAVLWPCARIIDVFWGRLFNTPGKILLFH